MHIEPRPPLDLSHTADRITPITPEKIKTYSVNMYICQINSGIYRSIFCSGGKQLNSYVNYSHLPNKHT